MNPYVSQLHSDIKRDRVCSNYLEYTSVTISSTHKVLSLSHLTKIMFVTKHLLDQKVNIRNNYYTSHLVWQML